MFCDERIDKSCRLLGGVSQKSHEFKKADEFDIEARFVLKVPPKLNLEVRQSEKK